RRRAVRLAAAALGGAAVGGAVHLITRLSGLPLFLVVGALAGLAVALLHQVYRRTARLAEVKLTIPQLSELTFIVDGGRQAGRLETVRGDRHPDLHPAAPPRGRAGPGGA